VYLHSHLLQGELEHRTPKTNYTRTSKKEYVKQLTRIERRQARIRQIRAQLGGVGLSPNVQEFATRPEAQYHIGTSQNEPKYISFFLQQNAGDPAIKASFQCPLNG
jgi:hypothetical protein